METRARYLLIGAFTLAVALACFGFVYWLHNVGLGERSTYRVRFESAVPGLRVGSNVLFNGVRVGEVTALGLVPDNPRQVMATIVVDRVTPVRADTTANVETQGLMAAPSVTLRGGAKDARPLPAERGAIPVIAADPRAGTDTMTAARDTLRRIDAILDDNAAPLKDTIANLKTFTDALARNSDRIDSILTGVERMTGGGPTPPPPTVYDLAAPASFPGLGPVPKQQIGVPDPTVPLNLDTQRLGLVNTEGQPAYVAGAQWSDSLPKLMQARLVQSFENAGFAVARTGDNFSADLLLAIDVRQFRLREKDRTAEVALGVKLVTRDGRIVASRILATSAVAKDSEAASTAAALGEAFVKAVTEIVPWVAREAPKEE